jgi:preprotein translocase subunit SecD
MAPPALIFVLAVFLVVGCGSADGDRAEGDLPAAQLVAYHLEEHWVESEPPTRRKDLTAPPGARVVNCGPPAEACPGVPEIPRQTVFYALTGEPELTTSDFEVDSARATFDRSSGAPVVHVTLTGEGQARFRTLTRRMARVGQRQRRHQQLALVVDDRLVSFPTIDYQLTPNGIDSRVIEITGVGSPTETEEIAKRLRGN